MLIPGEGMEKALARADEALYRAKEGGRDRFVVAKSRSFAPAVLGPARAALPRATGRHMFG
jgi:hypothetical protein